MVYGDELILLRGYVHGDGVVECLLSSVMHAASREHNVMNVVIQLDQEVATGATPLFTGECPDLPGVEVSGFHGLYLLNVARQIYRRTVRPRARRADFRALTSGVEPRSQALISFAIERSSAFRAGVIFFVVFIMV
jgi:hypothetical protein